VSIPKDASAIILIKDDKVLLAQRNPKLSFLGGWHAFSGGKLDKSDSDIEIKNCQDIEIERFIVCAVRELFEEVGVLLVRGGDKLTIGQRASLHDDLVSGRSTFREILDDWNLWIDAEDFQYTGFWTTPKFSPVRFKTRFFMANCPPKQTPYEAISEMQNIEFITPKEALNRWEKSDILISPPVLISLQELAKFSPQRHRDTENNKDFSFATLRLCVESLLEKSRKFDGIIDYLELNSRTIVFPLKTKTLPPATHTNCFIVGRKEFIVIDAASPEVEEQEKLHNLVDELIERGGICKEIVVSHLHSDHFGGEIALQNHLKTKGFDVPISTHKLTAEKLSHIKFDKFIENGDVYNLLDENGEVFQLQTLHTRGHAQGLLNFYDEEYGFLLSTDNVVGAGTVVIAEPGGNMSDYLQTLERLKNLPNLKHLCGSHGSAIFDAKAKIQEYISHRLERENQILQLLSEGVNTSEELVEKIYVDLKPELFPLAIKSVEAHLEKIKDEKLFNISSK
jgi:glyoxylase-like metal-dependent hydrolase (beta-lactamase superfamily II)/8-oxo-dGTP pyrophosphatase MutT (NUDIX family)